jgi:nucleoside 2-deoxyribosyltransferase
MNVSVYLAGAIRNEEIRRKYDEAWREHAKNRILKAIPDEDIRIISPMAFKSFDGEVWKIFDMFPIDDQATLQQDMTCIAQSDMLLMNLLPFEERYSGRFDVAEVLSIPFGEGCHPNVGTFSEFGIALATRKPVVVVSNDAYIKSHPFMRAGAIKIVSTVDEGIDYIIGLVSVLLSKPEIHKAHARRRRQGNE